MKRTKCYICQKPLTGIKTKFCGDVCYRKHKAEYDRDIRLNRREQTPKRNCKYCGKLFQPIRENNVACSKPCSYDHAKQIQNKRRKKNPLPKVKPMGGHRPGVILPATPVPIKLKTTAEFNVTSTTKDAVLEYLKNGGKISKLPDEPQGKSPSVNIPFGYTSSELFGPALEYELSPEANASRA